MTNTTAESMTPQDPDALNVHQVNGAMGAGCKTPEGLVQSAKNSTTHGGYGRKRVLIRGETQEDYDAFEARLWAKWNPQDELEEYWTDDFIWQSWLMRRVDIYEGRTDAMDREDPAADCQKFARIRRSIRRDLQHAQEELEYLQDQRREAENPSVDVDALCHQYEATISELNSVVYTYRSREKLTYHCVKQNIPIDEIRMHLAQSYTLPWEANGFVPEEISSKPIHPPEASFRENHGDETLTTRDLSQNDRPADAA